MIYQDNANKTTLIDTPIVQYCIDLSHFSCCDVI